MTNEKVYDLEERTAKFAEEIIAFCKMMPSNEINMILIKQLAKAGTSVGANYCEADCAETKKDFEHKLGICKKEAKETKYWLRIILKSIPESSTAINHLSREANELILIFSTIIKKSRINSINAS